MLKKSLEKNSKVSVIIPVFNSEKFLQKTLESILNQTYSNLEVICIDDGSTDKSLKILNHYKDEITIVSQENLGLAAAVNTGIKKMQGNWLKWMSPDDLLYPDAIEILVSEALNYPENSIMYSNWDIIDEQNKKLRCFHESNYNNLNNFDFNVRLLDEQQININTSLIPYHLIQKNCLFNLEAEMVIVDYDFFLRSALLFNTRFHLIDKKLIGYRVHENQLSHKNIIQGLKFRESIRDTILGKIDSSLREKYLQSLNNYRHKKPIPKKFMNLGLKLISRVLPSPTADFLLRFYLINLRSRR